MVMCLCQPRFRNSFPSLPNTLRPAAMATAKSWGVEEVSSWLTQVGLQQLVDGFREQEVDGEVLLQLTFPDFKIQLLTKILISFSGECFPRV